MAFEEPKEKYFRGLDLSKLVKKQEIFCRFKHSLQNSSTNQEQSDQNIEKERPIF
jgi:hypothetical protein